MRNFLRSIMYISAAAVLFLLSLPFLSDLIILPAVMKKLPFDEKKISISRITPWQISGSLSFTKNGAEITIPRFQKTFSPAGLIRGHLTSMVIDSAAFALVVEDGKIMLEGVDAFHRREGKSSPPSPVMLPFSVDTLILKNCTIGLRGIGGAQKKYVNVSGTLEAGYDNRKRKRRTVTRLAGQLSLGGALNAEVKIETNLKADEYISSFELVVPQISSFANNFIFLQNGEVLSGSCNVVGSLRSKGIGVVEEYMATAEFRNFSGGTAKWEIGGNSRKEPVLLTLHGDGEKANIGLSGGILEKPQRCSLDLTADYFFKQRKFSGSVDFLPELTGKSILLEFEGSRKEKHIETDYKLTGEPFALAGNIAAEAFELHGSLTAEEEGLKGRLRGSFPRLAVKQQNVDVEDVTVKGSFALPRAGEPIDVPVNVSVGRIRYKNNDIAALKAALALREGGVEIESVATSPFNDELILSCSGNVSLQGSGSINCSLPEFTIDSASFPHFLNLPEPLGFKGRVAAQLHLDVAGWRFTGSAGARYTEGSITWDQYQASDVAVKLDLPDLPNIRSSPEQLCTIGGLELGKIKMSDVKIHWRIDDRDTLFIEKTGLRWCGGRVEAGALRLQKGMREIETTLYCDRLAYTELLGQFGVGDAEGEGALNGRLPISITQNGLQFDDGFLFSTPGNSGIVRFTNTQQLRQNMPAADKVAYLDYSLKALENFSYNWTKLRFNTVGEELLLALQLDGKPVEPLPYGYKKGQIVKTKKGTGLQHPIRLDVNFRLPLNELFRYGQSIQSIMEKM